jgi:hypothetical protein
MSQRTLPCPKLKIILERPQIGTIPSPQMNADKRRWEQPKGKGWRRRTQTPSGGWWPTRMKCSDRLFISVNLSLSAVSPASF